MRKPQYTPEFDGHTPQFEQFLADCGRSVNGWQPNQVTYPRRLTVPMDGSKNYDVRVDIRLGAEQQPPATPETQVEDVLVRCGLGARLVPVGGSITVDDTRWMFMPFDRQGVAEWTWTVSATKPDDAQVRLELRPALAASNGDTVLVEESARASLFFPSDVHVEATWMDRVYAWFTDSWVKITAIVAAFGAAITAAAWVSRQRRALRDAAPDSDSDSASGSDVDADWD